MSKDMYEREFQPESTLGRELWKLSPGDDESRLEFLGRAATLAASYNSGRLYENDFKRIAQHLPEWTIGLQKFSSVQMKGDPLKVMAKRLLTDQEERGFVVRNERIPNRRLVLTRLPDVYVIAEQPMVGSDMAAIFGIEESIEKAKQVT